MLFRFLVSKKREFESVIGHLALLILDRIDDDQNVEG